MHNVHFILVNADSAGEAARTVEREIAHWGDENNWSAIGGIASEDGTDDLETHESTIYPLSFLDDEAGLPQGINYFQRAVAYVKLQTDEPVWLRHGGHAPCASIKDAVAAVAGRLLAFDTENGELHDLWKARGNLEQLGQIMAARRSAAAGYIPEFYSWCLDETGLTDMSGSKQSARRYLVFVDMHS